MKFWAILRDSFREAVDGWIIYVMLILAGVLMVGLGSMSFTPVSAEEAIPPIVQRFVLMIPGQGEGRAVGATPGVEYTASDYQTAGHEVRFQIHAKRVKEKNGGPDGFRQAVAGWLRPANKTQKFKVPAGALNGQSKNGKGPNATEIELALRTEVTPEEAAAITTEQMEAFIRNEFAVHAGMNNVAVHRVTDGVQEPTYRFDVDAKNATTALGWPQKLGLFFGGVELGTAPLGAALFIIEDQIVNGVGAGLTLLIAVVITAFFIPNLIRKGSLDLIIAKPVGRVQLLIYKYLGGLTFIFLLSAFTIGGVWLVLSLRSGYWDLRFLLVIPALTFTFALLYAVSTLMAVLTRSAIAAILVTLAFAFLLYAVGQAKTLADVSRNTNGQAVGTWPGWSYRLVDGLNKALPRYKDLDKLTSKLTAEGTMTPLELRFREAVFDYPSWSEAIGLSLLYIAAMLALASWRFVTRDG